MLIWILTKIFYFLYSLKFEGNLLYTLLLVSIFESIFEIIIMLKLWVEEDNL